MEVVNLLFRLKQKHPELRSQGVKINNKSLIVYANNMGSESESTPKRICRCKAVKLVGLMRQQVGWLDAMDGVIPFHVNCVFTGTPPVG